MALKACLACGALTNAGSYCQRHQPRNGSTRAWRTMRDVILDRDQYTCQLCGARAEHIDHITPLSEGGTSRASNLRATCAPCNLTRASN